MSTIEPDRISVLKDAPVHHRGKYVLYWMQQSQRAHLNPALEAAVGHGNDLGLPVLVTFGLTPFYPEANARHYHFLLEGLRFVEKSLRERGIRLVIRPGSPPGAAEALARDAALIVCDRGYLRSQRQWRERLVQNVDRRIVQVEGDVVVPVESAGERAESAARTLRPRIRRNWKRFLREWKDSTPERDSLSLGPPGGVDLARPLKDLVSGLGTDPTVPPVARFRGGTDEARARLEQFIRNGLEGYSSRRNRPGEWATSMLSPYLHFGQISPVEAALKARRHRGSRGADKQAFLEELIIRRELSVNFVHYRPDVYDSWKGLPRWARATLEEHRSDRRPHRYTRRELEAAGTHDPYWNAAMNEMRHTGFLQGHMRMYWGKKIIEWSGTPRYAFRTALYLNNKYLLDGRDPNSFTGVAWCFGLHDRGWPERPVFGKVRYMNARGLERKFDMNQYIETVNELVQAEKVSPC